MRPPAKCAGFTLIELLVVIAIISLLATVVIGSFGSARAKARDAQRISDLGRIALALQLYLEENAHYPRSDCGWDCNGYRYSYDAVSWGALAADLAPYLNKLPIDPLNTSCMPWADGCYSYAYGNVGRVTYNSQFDLVAQLEDPSSRYRCGVAGYTFYFDDQGWCMASGGPYSSQIYDVSEL